MSLRRIAVLLAGLIAVPGTASPETAARDFIRIATWDLAFTRPKPAAAAAPAAERAPEKPGYRHTFGSERRTASFGFLSPSRVPGVDADVIAIQGLSDPRKARQLFPAGDYHLIVSRQLLFKAPEADPGASRGVTAVAVRRRPDVRVIAQDHLLAPAVPVTDPAQANGIWATAVRLLIGGQALWVVAVDLTHDCEPAAGTGASERAACGPATSQAARLSGWVATRRGEGDASITAGNLGSEAAAVAVLDALAGSTGGRGSARAVAVPAPASGDRRAQPTPGPRAVVTRIGALAVYSDAGSDGPCAPAKDAAAPAYLALDAPGTFAQPASARLIAGENGTSVPGSRCTLALDVAVPGR